MLEKRPYLKFKRSIPAGIHLTLAVFLAFGFFYVAFAVPPATPYNPGETLNPGCSPGDTNCTVSVLPSGSSGQIQFNSSGALAGDSIFVWDTTNDRLGVGTSTPYAKLSVVGETVAAFFTATTTATSTFTGGLQANALNIVSTTATSTFANGINVAGGCLSVNGTCVGGSALSGGAANKVALWTGASTLSNNSLFHWDDSNVRLGIGTSSPYAKLSVVGQTVAEYFTATSTTATSTFQGITLATSGGNVGIGTTTPGSKITLGTGSFSVPVGSASVPSITFNGDTTTGIFSGGTTRISFTSNGTAMFHLDEFNNVRAADGSAGIPAYNFISTNNTGMYYGGNSDLGFSTVGVQRLFISNTGNIGIATSSPYAKLSVVGETVASHFTATSTTATSSISGIFSVGSTTPASTALFSVGTSSPLLFVDKVNGRVGVRTAAPGSNLSLGTGSFSIPVGSASAPSITFNGDTTTGIFSPGTTGIGFTSGGDEVLRIDATNRLRATAGTAAIPSYVFIDDNSTGMYYAGTSALGFSTVGVQRLFISNTGNIGIATSSPYAKLSVVGETVARNFTATSTTAVSSFMGATGFGTASPTSGAQVQVLNVYADARLGYTNGGLYYGVYGNGNAPSGSAYGIYGKTTSNPKSDAYGIYGVVSNADGTAISAESATVTTGRLVRFNHFSSTFSGDMLFANMANGSGSFTGNFFNIQNNGATRMVLTAAGNLGLGTSTPYARLSVVGETVAEYFTATSTTATSTFAGAVGIGTTSPMARFAINSTAPFTVSSTGAITGGAGVTSIIGGVAYTGTRGLYGENGDNLSIGVNSSDIIIYPRDHVETSGTVQAIRLGEGTFFNPTSGTAIYDLVTVSANINQTGGANGVTRGIYINPTITAAADWRALETVRGNVIFGSTSGNVGIGTTSPYAKLSVVGQTVAEYFTATSTTATSTFAGAVGIGTTTTAVNNALVVQGSVCITGGTACPSGLTAGSLRVDTAGGAADDPGDVFDLAERYPASEVMEPADIAGIDPHAIEKAVVRKAQPGDTALGIVSTKAAIAINGGDLTLGPASEATSTKPLIALAGRVPVKVSAEAGDIQKGDRVTLSPTLPGVGVKATSSSYTVGIALEDHTFSSPADVGQVLVFVNLSWSKLDPAIQNGAIIDGRGESSFWSVEETTGRIKFISAGLDLNDQDIVSVRSIIGSAGKWSIGTDGKLVVEELEVRGGAKIGSPERRTGITLYDEQTGAPYCLTISGGLTKTTAGECGAPATSTTLPAPAPEPETSSDTATSTPSTTDTSATSTPQSLDAASTANSSPDTTDVADTMTTDGTGGNNSLDVTTASSTDPQESIDPSQAQGDPSPPSLTSGETAAF